MASPLPATVRVTILPKLTALIEALDVLSAAFQDISDSLLVARDTLQDVEDDSAEDQPELAAPCPNCDCNCLDCRRGACAQCQLCGCHCPDVHAELAAFADVPPNARSAD